MKNLKDIPDQYPQEIINKLKSGVLFNSDDIKLIKAIRDKQDDGLKRDFNGDIITAEEQRVRDIRGKMCKELFKNDKNNWKLYKVETSNLKELALKIIKESTATNEILMKLIQEI